MYYLLLSLIVLIVQGFLDMADWWVLSNNWLMAGFISFSCAISLSNQSLISFSSLPSFTKGWVLLASIMNLVAIYLETDMPWWKQDILLFGFTGLIMLGFTCWQKRYIPMRSVCFGAIIAILTIFWFPSIIWMLMPVLFMVHFMCYSIHNLCGLLTGMLSMMWMLYCIMTLCISDATGTTFILSYLHGWSEFEFSLPTIIRPGFTGWIMLVLTTILGIFSIVYGFLRASLSSLRIRSIVTFLSSCSFLILILLSTCWSLYLITIGIIMTLLALLALGNEYNRVSKNGITIIVSLFLLLGAGEPLLVMSIDYISTIHFTLPFDIPWPW